MYFHRAPIARAVITLAAVAIIVVISAGYFSMTRQGGPASIMGVEVRKTFGVSSVLELNSGGR